MNTRIYTSSGHRSVIPYVNCGSIKSLLSSARASVELVAGELQIRVLAFVLCVSFLRVAWAAFYSQPKGVCQLPYPYKCGILT
jgi:hypothetical protein